MTIVILDLGNLKGDMQLGVIALSLLLLGLKMWPGQLFSDQSVSTIHITRI
ncbi:hypothetical protein Syun_021253 [Stephania yunnanensis]|uniref:Uncharacterized protein n=1 Tax=Stephania yunnanensis TaxID=152371 RepID=A0AAP0IFC8_9MAGN